MSILQVNRVHIGDIVQMVRHDQSPELTRPTGPYKIVDIYVTWAIGDPALQEPDVFVVIQHPDGWQESRPWYLVSPL